MKKAQTVLLLSFVIIFLGCSNEIQRDNVNFSNDKAYYNQALYVYKNGNYQKAAELFKKSCDMGYSEGCFSLGILYGKGQGVSQDYQKAVELYKKSCDMGYAQGCYNLGLLYGNGQGISQDYTKAKELFKKSCDMGVAQGCKSYAIFKSLLK